MFEVAIPHLARQARDRQLTIEEIEEVFGAGDCANTQTCMPHRGCNDDGDDSDWCVGG